MKKFNNLFVAPMVGSMFTTSSEAVEALVWGLSDDTVVTTRHYCDNSLEHVGAGCFVYHAALETPYGDFALFQLEEGFLRELLALVGMSKEDLEAVVETATNWDPNWKYELPDATEAEKATMEALAFWNAPASQQSLMALCGRY